MDNLMKPRGIVLYTGIVLAVLPCLMVTAAPPRLMGLSAIKDERYQESHLNSVYSALPSDSQKTNHLQRLTEKVPSTIFPGIDSQSPGEPGEAVDYRGSSLGIYKQPHEYPREGGVESESIEKLTIPRFPAFSPELDRDRSEGSLGPLSLLDQLAPQLW